AEDGSRRHFQLWLVGDQLSKGAATNADQILELLSGNGMLSQQSAAAS
ncbi:MAG: aspartate-semialdehyde dehydrogenase, partial [Candidatus Eremiobacteraeota bacterium]|nr:aspartate-semialdehyde dehydrogenase [Candidatus Eremiobacteraeota bacterium]